jgi:glycosyltransferase involved in cell wall biosynthesis
MTKLWRSAPAAADMTAQRPLAARSIVFLGTAHDNGGSSILAGNLAAAMRAHGHHVEEWYLFASASGTPAGARVFAAGGRVRSPLKLAALLIRVVAALRAQKPDTVFGLQSLSNLIAGFGGWLAGVRNRVATHHNPASQLDPVLMRLDALAGRLGLYTCIIACAETVGASFARNGKAYARRMRVIPNGQKKPGRCTREAARRELGLAENAIVIGQIGRLCEQKNQGFAVALIKEIADATLLLVGSGPDEAALKAAAVANGVVNRVRFVPALDYERIGVFYSAVDAVIFPSRFEGLSLAAIEAIHAGVPMVCSDIPSFRELFHDSPYLAQAILVPLGDRALWLSRIRAVLSGASLRERMASEFARLSPAFDFDAMARRYLAALD